MVSKFFSVKELLWLPQWNRMASFQDGVNPQKLDALKDLAFHMDIVREFVNKPIIVHVTYRSTAYNALVGGAQNSPHMCLGHWAAMDFNVDGLDTGAGCDAMRALFEPMLETWGLRMEKLPGADWVHLDSHPVLPGGERYFIP